MSCIIIDLPSPGARFIHAPAALIYTLLFQHKLVSHQLDGVAFHLVDQLFHHDHRGTATGPRGFTGQLAVLAFGAGLPTELVKLFDSPRIHISQRRIEIAGIAGSASVLSARFLVAAVACVFGLFFTAVPGL